MKKFQCWISSIENSMISKSCLSQKASCCCYSECRMLFVFTLPMCITIIFILKRITQLTEHYEEPTLSKQQRMKAVLSYKYAVSHS